MHAGLIALAVSDMIFCIICLPHAWIPVKKFYHSHLSFEFYYLLYSDGLINTFIMTSTWLTVAMATSRYLGICHPLRARELVGMTFARISIVFVFIFSIFFNILRFFKFRIDTMECIEGHTVYYGDRGFMESHENLDLIYNIVYFIICIAIPLVTLTFCNVHLIKALRRSASLQQVHQRPQASIDGTHRFTFTLVVIVVMYIILVIPAEIINFHREVVKEDDSRTGAHNVGAAIANTLQVNI